MSDESDCDCLNCSLARFIGDRYADGVDKQEMIDILMALGDLAGFILSEAPDDFREIFGDHVDGAITAYRNGLESRLYCFGNDTVN